MKRALLATVLLAMMLLVGIALSYAQETEKHSQAESTKPPALESQPNTDQRDRSIQPYRLDFSFSELEGGKKINTRHYTISLTAGSADEVKIGTRVPVASGEPAQYQYLDLGTNIWANLKEGGQDLQLEVRGEISWTKHEDVDVSPRAPHTTFTPPIVSQMKVNGSTLLQTGKPILIGIADDPYSNRQFELEVTATRLR